MSTEILFQKAMQAATTPSGRMSSIKQKISESGAKRVARARAITQELYRKSRDGKTIISASVEPSSLGGHDVVFHGGKKGPHSISAEASDEKRIVAHWNGYLSNNGIHPYGLGDTVGFYGPYSRGEKGAIHRWGIVTHVTPTVVTVRYQPRTMPDVKRFKTLKMKEVWLVQAARAPRPEPIGEDQ